MFKVLMASQPVRSSWLGGSAFSTVAHGGLIAAAVLTTGGISASVRETRTAAAEQINYLTPVALPAIAPNARLRSEAKARSAAPKQQQLVAPDLSDVQAEIDKSLTTPDEAVTPDLTVLTNKWLTQPDALSTAQSNTTDLVMQRFALVRPDGGLYTEDMVEETVTPQRGNPAPRYPAVLRDMGIEGDFVVHFVVDSTGSVVQDHIEFPNAMHRLFIESVRDALLRSRYMPARVGGTPVAQLVVQEFRFVIRH